MSVVAGSVATAPRVLVVEHEPACPPDRVGAWLLEAGVELEIARPHAGEDLPEHLQHDGLLVLGGHMGAHDDAEAPWLPATRHLLAAAVASSTPTLGICLGAQLLAVATGGRVEVGARGIEAGVIDVRWRPEVAGDPLFGDAPPTAGPSMHLDAVVALPPDATWLGETATYPHQAFRVGASAWGVQFHPEASLATYTGWAQGHADDWLRWGLDGEEVVAQLVRRQIEVTAAGERLAARFAGVVAASTRARRR